MQHWLLITLLVTSFVSAYADDTACESLFAQQCEDIKTCEPPTIIGRIKNFVTGREYIKQNPYDMNNKTLVDLAEVSVTPASAGRKHELSNADVQKLYDAVANHSVASLQQYRKYDPKDEGIGFCFGRAMAAHLDALWNFQLNNSSMRKVWAVGTLRTPSALWSFHVATVVRGADKNWWVIDPIMNKPLTINEWYKKMQSYDYEKSMRIYVTEPQRFFAEPARPYNKQEINEAFFNGFFTDLLSSYRKTDLATAP